MSEERVPLETPAAWRDLNITQLHGPVLVIGATNSGKSTFARYLYKRLTSQSPHVGYIDADAGQNNLEVPTTVALALSRGQGDNTFPPQGQRRMCFIGSNTPYRHTTTVLVALYRLFVFAVQKHVSTLVIDTSGLVDPSYGGQHLKWSKIDLFRPCTVIALQKAAELEPILTPLRNYAGVRLIELPPSSATRVRSREERRAYRAARYREYFNNARRCPLPYQRLAVFPRPQFTPNQLVALNNRAGFTLALGLVERADDTVVWLKTPWSGQGKVVTLRLGDLELDPETFEDTPIHHTRQA